MGGHDVIVKKHSGKHKYTFVPTKTDTCTQNTDSYTITATLTDRIKHEVTVGKHLEVNGSCTPQDTAYICRLLGLQ